MNTLRDLVFDGDITDDYLYQQYEHHANTFRAFANLKDRIEEIDPEWWENHMIEFFEEEFTREEIKNIFGHEFNWDDEELDESIKTKFNLNLKKLNEELDIILNENKKDYIRVFDVGHPNSRCVALMRGDEEIDNFGTGWKNPQSEEQIRKEARRFFKGLPKDIEVIIEDT